MKNKPLLEVLVKNTCLDTCLFFKLGLKFNTSNPNPKSLMRIIEKMLFKNDKSLMRSKTGKNIS